MSRKIHIGTALAVITVLIIRLDATFKGQRLDGQVLWNEGMQACKDLGYDGLAVFDTRSKEDQLWDLLESTSLGDEDMWVGMTYSPLLKWFAWSNGEPVESKRWSADEPSTLGEHNCGRLRNGRRRGYASTNCSWKKASLCGNYDIPGNDSNSVLFTMWLNVYPSASDMSTLWHGKVRSLIECSQRSTLNSEHKFVAFDAETKDCQILSRMFDVQNGVVPRPGAFVAVTFKDIRDTLQ